MQFGCSSDLSCSLLSPKLPGYNIFAGVGIFVCSGQDVNFFSAVLGYPGLTVVGVLCSDDVQWSWLLFIRFFLPFGIW